MVFTKGRLRLRHFPGKLSTGLLTKSIHEPSGSTLCVSATCSRDSATKMMLNKERINQNINKQTDVCFMYLNVNSLQYKQFSMSILKLDSDSKKSPMLQSVHIILVKSGSTLTHECVWDVDEE